MYKGCCLFFIGTVKNNPPSEKHIGIVVYGKLYGKERFGRFGTENKKYFRRWVIFKIRNARCAGVGGGGSHRFGLCCNMAGRLCMDKFVFLTSIKVQYIPQMSLSSDILFSLRLVSMLCCQLIDLKMNGMTSAAAVLSSNSRK